MDELEAKKELKRIYKNYEVVRKPILFDEESFIKIHMDAIIEANKGEWDNADAKKYLENWIATY